ncbi:T9SS type A sorting domain-containing protein [Rhodocaloribacter litoris]|uniref:sugar-binding protein n=1 Tax=Rhodocaloribacter litoris TaxID=2558931 RepID=UPI0014249319|nr:sugar-binding protein [Rhodocaloribacter litoris]QXD14031.1 T9SS type A sorting domain-containing protein [Rhodocaloribacter litoris]
MNRNVTTTMMALALVGTLGVTLRALGQPVPRVPQIFTFDALVDFDSLWTSYGAPVNFGYDPDTVSYPEGREYFVFFEYGDGDPGTRGKAVQVDWSLFTDQSWGGSNGLLYIRPDPGVSSPESPDPDAFFSQASLWDLSDFTHIHLRYKTLVPANAAATIRIKLHDASEGVGTEPSAVTEDWYTESGDVYTDASGEWKVWTVPLVDLGLPGQTVPAGGFSRPGCQAGGDPLQTSGCWSGLLGNGKLDLDKIGSLTIEFTGPQAGAANDSTLFGTIVFDELYVSGVRYELLGSFDDPGALAHWKNSNAGSYTLEATTDTTQGSGAIDLTYNLVGDQGWGGSVDIQRDLNAGQFFPDMTARTHLSLFYKVLEPASDPASVWVNLKLFDYSTGQKEEWHYSNVVNVLDDTTGQWRRLLLPLDGFAIPSWVGERGDETLNLDQIGGWQLQVQISEGASSSGRILFDRLTSYGERQTDFTPPEAVQGFDVLATQSYENLISWQDVPGESRETYTIYFSEAPIDSVSQPGVIVAASNLPEGTGIFTHRLFYPNDDTEVSYHYAITITDEAGNTSVPTMLPSPVTNLAKGLPTISMTPPANFAADGDLSEWSGTPIHLEPNGDFYGHVAQGFEINGPDDLSADVYLAVDNEALYVAVDVTDDAYFPVPDGVTSERWLYDGAELYIGLYDSRGPKHDRFMTGNEPDYKFYLYRQVFFRDGGSEVEAGSPDYAWARTDRGYVIEARIRFDAHAFDTAPLFQPKNGMRVPLDIVIMDNDVGGQAREGILTYSPDNDDNSWESPRYWFYTWIGDRFAVGTEPPGPDGVPTRFQVYANYPNPFSRTTWIRYDLPRPERVVVKVYNTLGQEVQTLVDQMQAAGTHELHFDASRLSAGLYFYQVRAGRHVATRSMVVVR